jgi:hypothetical protein
MQQQWGACSSGRITGRPPRYVRLDANESSTAGLLYGCPVVTVEGEAMGNVDHLIVDILTSQLRYVVLEKKKNRAEIALPWHALYFDSAAAKLVFYTLA